MKRGKLILAAILMAVIGYLVGPTIVNEAQAAFSARIATINVYPPNHSAQVFLYDRNDAIATSAYSTGIGSIAMFAATKDDVTYGGTNTTVAGTSVHPVAGWVTRKKCIDIETEGTWAGHNADRTLRLVSVSPGNTITALLTLAGGTFSGDVVAKFTVCGTGNGATTQEAWGSLLVSNGSTVYAKSGRATGAIKFNVASWLRLQWISGNAGDAVTQKYARYWLNP
jgi:hypothetical protein